MAPLQVATTPIQAIQKRISPEDPSGLFYARPVVQADFSPPQSYAYLTPNDFRLQTSARLWFLFRAAQFRCVHPKITTAAVVINSIIRAEKPFTFHLN